MKGMRSELPRGLPLCRRKKYVDEVRLGSYLAAQHSQVLDLLALCGGCLQGTFFRASSQKLTRLLNFIYINYTFYA